MCGRITNHQELDANARAFDAIVDMGTEWRPSFNVAPTQPLLVLGAREGQRMLRTMRWGLIPAWAKDASGAAACINARSETVAERPSFRNAYRKARRCAVLVSGWYEWKVEGKRKTPHWFHPRAGSLVALAGLWERWTDPTTGADVFSATVITCAPNTFAATIHDRMPVVLAGDDLARWIDPRIASADVHEVMRPCAVDVLDAWPVDTRVGSPRNNDEGLIVRAA